jgi:hypothetical protein
MAAACEVSNNLCGWAYDTKHSLVWRNMGQIILLNSSKSLSRCGVTGKNHKIAAHEKELFHALKGEAVNHIKRACAVWSTGVVA